MPAPYVIAPTVLTTATISLVVYSLALVSMLRGTPPPGVVRTGICRLISAVLYVGVGVISLRSVTNGALVGLGVYITMWLVWQGNALADAALSRGTRRNRSQKPESARHARI